MKIKALKSFCGSVTMTMNEVKDVDDKFAENLIAVGYAVAAENKADKAADKKKSDKNEAESNKP